MLVMLLDMAVFTLDQIIVLRDDRCGKSRPREEEESKEIKDDGLHVDKEKKGHQAR